MMSRVALSHRDQPQARLIAFYLPQFHPIPENDEWWGKGFTEWTNVAKAKPMFPGHYQPRLPADLGFYDLRVPETRIAQAELARRHGVEGFCYWHYWFAGRRLLERPFEEVLRTGEPDFPFCLAWANQSWTGIWHGDPDRVLIEQTYPGQRDFAEHFSALLDAFQDHRYIKVDGKPLFIVHDPTGLPEPQRFADQWQEMAVQRGLKGLWLVGIADPNWIPQMHGFDASIANVPAVVFEGLRRQPSERLPITLPRTLWSRLRARRHNGPTVFNYADAIEHVLPGCDIRFEHYPCVLPNWDNTPRSGAKGFVLQGSNPSLFKNHLRQVLQSVSQTRPEHGLVFLKSWNEWAEGNYLEPDQQFGMAYLQVLGMELGV